MGIAINSGNTGAAQNSQNQTQSVQEESKSRRQKHRSSITRMEKAAETAGKATGANGKNLTLFAGNITGKGSDLESRIQQKRDQARKQAMKLINDAWDADKKAADGIDALNKDKQEQLDKLNEYKQSLKDVNEREKQLQEEYNIDPDSQEQKDLELLKKYQNYSNGSDYADFSKEEVERLKELQNTPRTEYQDKALMLNGYRGEVRNRISLAEYKLMAISESVHDSKIDRLKSQDMLKADDSADKILDAAEKDVLGMVIDDTKENIDKKMEEEQKKAEEAADKRDEQQERIDKAKEERSEQQERIDESKQDAKEQREIIRNDAKTDILDINNGLSKKDVNNVEEVQKHIQKMLNDEKLINEDLKGIKIDFNY